MAFVLTAHDVIPAPPARSNAFAVSVTGDISGCETLKAAAGTGKKIYIQRVTMSAVNAATVTLGQGETASAVTNPIFGPITINAGTVIDIQVPGEACIALAANTALTADSSGADVFIYVQGYVDS